MGEAKRRRKKAEPVTLPIADKGEITSTTLYLTIETAFAEEIAAQPWFEKYSPVTQRVMKEIFYTGVAEMMRTVVYRVHTEDNGAVFDDLDKEIQAFNADIARHRAALKDVSELH